MNSHLENSMSGAALEVFNLLKRRGPLCPCQISVELFMSPRDVINALGELFTCRLASPRPDRNKKFSFDESEKAWGLSLSIDIKEKQNIDIKEKQNEENLA